MITSGELKNIREQLNATTYNKSKTAVVVNNDLARIRRAVMTKEKTQIFEENKIVEEQKMQKMAVAMARKQRM